MSRMPIRVPPATASVIKSFFSVPRRSRTRYERLSESSSAWAAPRDAMSASTTLTATDIPRADRDHHVTHPRVPGRGRRAGRRARQLLGEELHHLLRQHGLEPFEVRID